MTKSNPQELRVKDVGERGLLQRIKKYVSLQEAWPLRFGDDAVAVEFETKKYAVLKTDMLVGSTDVPKGMTAYQIGAKSVTMNVSDLAAKGVQPTGIIIALGLPRDFLVVDVEALVRGVAETAKSYNTHLLGGDTGEANDLIVSVMAFGLAEKVIPRTGAKAGDVVITTGDFGLTGAGLKMILQEFTAPSATIKEQLARAVYDPRARLDEGLILSDEKGVSSCMDSSDGLAHTLNALAHQSQVRIVVENPPIHPAVPPFATAHKLDLLEMVFNAGEEYELVATVSQDAWESLEKILPSLRRIGYVEKGEGVVLKTEKGFDPIPDTGWDHFSM
ncbi:MAG: thiamine-phosphate kinase [Candidatus Ranarchaeia archaeon]|jgi:thiamine-monophosphate kinase